MRQQHGVRDGENWDETIYNVFHRDGGEIRHFWGSEPGDFANPLWGLLDITPEGRGDFFPKLSCQ